MKHTPGPWRTGPINYADIYGANGDLVALIPKGFDYTIPNSHLIAAAPELLEACKAQHKALDILAALLVEKDITFFPSKSAAWPAVLQALAAIRKAEGVHPETAPVPVVETLAEAKS